MSSSKSKNSSTQ